jgi:hypothetical protein
MEIRRSKFDEIARPETFCVLLDVDDMGEMRALGES